MKIALVAPLMEAVPPKTYGGTERVVANLAEALSARGQQITVFANGESRVNGDLVVCRDRSLLAGDRLTESITDHIVMLDRVRGMADRFDVLHFHTEFLHFPMFENMTQKTLTTCHSRLDPIGHVPFFRRYNRYTLVWISDAHRRPLPYGNWVLTIPHGYPLDQFCHIPGATGNGNGGYLAFLGRINSDKGIEAAIEIARRSKLKLKIAARINSFDRPYWEQVIKQQVDRQQIEYVGEIDDEEKIRFMNGALALLFPIRWPEPFGLIMIEAMACGTPVIAYPCGSVPEVIKDGVTGRVVATTDEAVAAIGEVAKLDRGEIRKQFEERFSSDRMADAYIDVYRRVLASGTQRDTRRAVTRRLLPERGLGGMRRKSFIPPAPEQKRPIVPEDQK